jgi:hypothetical protein
MIQSEKQKSMSYYNFGKDRMEQSKNIHLSNKISNKENYAYEQLHTPQQKIK